MTRRWRVTAWSALALAGASLAGTGAFVAWPLPSSVTRPSAAPAITLVDRDGLVLRTTRAADGTRARWMPYAELDPDLITAFVAMEDRRYFEHGAIDWRAVARALRDDLLARRVVSGASTIAMQTARLVHPVPRGWRGKIVQTLWALRLGAHLDRQRILEQYLNRVPLGQGTVGVASAASFYFGASSRSLSVGQAAMLAGLAHAPSVDNPVVSPPRARARRALALSRMRRAGFATADAVARADHEPLLALDRATPFLAPHFTTHVLSLLSDETLASAQGDGVVRTSLDLTLQRQLEAEVRRTVLDLHDRGAEQAAAVVLDNRTGEVLAWVGSPDFWADTSGQTDMVISTRQPGSALKPFLYGLAFDRGWTPASVIADVARTYQTSTGPYHPRNYDHHFHGPVRARDALGSSYNIPAVELANRLGPASLLHTLHLAGFASLRESADYYGLGLALGNGDVSLLELANGYRALANGGVWSAVTATLGTRHALVAGDCNQRVPSAECRSSRFISPVSAALVLDILADPMARVSGFGIDTPLDFPFPTAAKTGTSRHFTDNWAVATTGGFTVAVWVGNFSGRPMDGVSGVTGAGPLLHRAVMLTAARYAPGVLPTPRSAGAVAVDICRLSGMRATAECPRTTEWFAPGTEPTAPCDWHRDGRVVLPAEYTEWSAQHAAETGTRALATATAATTDSAPARFRITSPVDGDRYQVPPGVDARYATVALRASGAADPTAVRWFVDGHPTADARFRLRPGPHVIRARVSSDSDEVHVIVE